MAAGSKVVQGVSADAGGKGKDEGEGEGKGKGKARTVMHVAKVKVARILMEAKVKGLEMQAQPKSLAQIVFMVG